MRFKPGNNANPGGRPVGSKSMHLKRGFEICSDLVPDAKRVFKDALSSKKEAIRLKAAEYVFDRCYGKPKQSTEVTGQDGADLFRAFVDAPAPISRDEWIANYNKNLLKELSN